MTIEVGVVGVVVAVVVVVKVVVVVLHQDWSTGFSLSLAFAEVHWSRLTLSYDPK